MWGKAKEELGDDCNAAKPESSCAQKVPLLQAFDLLLHYKLMSSETCTLEASHWLSLNLIMYPGYGKKENARQLDIGPGIGRLNRCDFQIQSFHRDGLNVQESSFMDLASIYEATNNFSNSNFLGKGGFGPVYKGILSDGKEVAVKRLSTWSEQGINEFTNEMIELHAAGLNKLGYLTGQNARVEEGNSGYSKWCTEDAVDSVTQTFYDGADELQFYELRCKATRMKQSGRPVNLDYAELNSVWQEIDKRRPIKMICDADLRTRQEEIQKDRIYDFLAGLDEVFDSLFQMDQTQDATNRIVGTLGYMAPEYAMHGCFSAKSDDFTFGELVLEIITGRQNGSFNSEEEQEYLSPTPHGRVGMKEEH
eukprot:XP_024448861.1 cysteine-rich receptor-like protein kinase 8 [Populus trichocarpa]